MKKVIITVALILGVGLMHLNAQEAKEVKKTNFGIKVEANMSNFIMDDMTGWKSNFGAGTSTALSSFDNNCYFCRELLVGKCVRAATS